MRSKSFLGLLDGQFDGIKSKVNRFWLFMTLETNVILTERVNCGLKVLLWEAGRPVSWVLEELELKPTQPQTEVGLGFGLSLAIISSPRGIHGNTNQKIR